MNLELLEEIHNLQDDGKNDIEIANFLGMSKSNMLLCLRMERIIFDKYENVVEENKRLVSFNKSYLKQIDSLKNDLQKEKDKLHLLKSKDKNDYIQEISFLKRELENERDYNLEYEKMQNKYERIPKFIKRWF